MDKFTVAKRLIQAGIVVAIIDWADHYIKSVANIEAKKVARAEAQAEASEQIYHHERVRHDG